MENQKLKAVVTANNGDNLLLSITKNDGANVNIYWPTILGEGLETGDEFLIKLSGQGNEEETHKPSEENLRALLYDLIN